jgi:hypothetical protein
VGSYEPDADAYEAASCVEHDAVSEPRDEDPSRQSQGRSSRRCHAVSDLRSVWRLDSGYAENQLRRLPIPAGDHTPGDVVVSFGSRSAFAMWKTCWRSVGLWSRTRPFGAGSITSVP